MYLLTAKQSYRKRLLCPVTGLMWEWCVTVTDSSYTAAHTSVWLHLLLHIV
jgi:hypothetical protein